MTELVGKVTAPRLAAALRTQELAASMRGIYVPQSLAGARDLLRAAGLLPGLHNLDPIITFNSIAVAPMFRYKAQDAGALTWPAWTYGDTLSVLLGSGATFGLSGPFGGPSDGHMDPGGAGATAVVYASPNGTLGDVGTEDLIFELVFWYDGVATQRGVFCKRPIANTQGYGLTITGSPSGNFTLRTTLQSLNVSFALRYGWNHLLVFINRSGVASGSGLGFVNGTTVGNANVSAGAGESASNANAFTLFRQNSTGDQANRFDQPFSYIAGWKAASGWLPDDVPNPNSPIHIFAGARFASLAKFPEA